MSLIGLPVAFFGAIALALRKEKGSADPVRRRGRSCGILFQLG